MPCLKRAIQDRRAHTHPFGGAEVAGEQLHVAQAVADGLVQLRRLHVRHRILHGRRLLQPLHGDLVMQRNAGLSLYLSVLPSTDAHA